MSAEAAFRALDPTRDWTTYKAAMAVRCPWCRAHPGSACRSYGTPLQLGHKVHPSRVDASP